MSESEIHPTSPRSTRVLWRIGMLLGVLLLLGTRIASVYSEAINWDEFALLKNAAHSLASGELHAGGRPGLAVMMLLPLVSQCADEMAIVQNARLLWLAFTVALLAGFAFLLLGIEAGARHTRRERSLDALLGLGLFALVPAFLEWSIQVRSDQVALAAGLWAGVAFLASRRRPALALLAGVLFGVGYLASQKLLYVGALVGLIAVGQLWLAQEWKWRRELSRGALALAALGGVIAAFPWGVAAVFPGEAAHVSATTLGSSFKGGVGVFAFYRQTIGYSAYLGLLPSLLPHALLAVLLGRVTPEVWREGGDAFRRVMLAWGVLLLGLLVGLFHAAAFAYFWMTLGLFPAAALALARRPLAERLPASAQVRKGLALGLVALIALPGLVQIALMLTDTQSNQRTSLEFVQRNFAEGEDGFHPEGALFCRLASPPFPIYFSQHLYAYFGRDAEISKRSASELIENFESRQVRFVLDSFRLGQFPGSVRQFWLDHYQPYRGSVMVAGRYFSEEQPVSDFDLVVDGEYRWLPIANAGSLRVDGLVIPPGGRVHLRNGPHQAEDSAQGYLVLALSDPPGEADRPFYRSY